MNISSPFSSLKHRNFRLYFLGMCASTLGIWIQNTALPWLAYSLTGSPWLLGLVSALQFTPALLFSLFAGALTDRLNKKRLLLFTQAASLAVTLFLAFWVATGRIQYWQLLLATGALGLINSLDMPARQAFLQELVEGEAVLNAVSLNAALFNLSRALGPALAGVIMRFWSLWACFFVNSLSFGAVLLCLFFIHPKAGVSIENAKRGIFSGTAEGLKFIAADRGLLIPLLITGVVSSFGSNHSVLAPVLAAETLKLDEGGYGLFLSFLGLGAFLGAMLTAVLKETKNWLLYGFPLLCALSLIFSGSVSAYTSAAVSFALTGFFFTAFQSGANARLQLTADRAFLGRVMSAYTLAYAGTLPLGSLFAGKISEGLGARAGFLACGGAILALLLPLYFWLWRQKRTKGAF